MEAEVSEPVLPAKCAILPAPGVKAAVAPNLPWIEATNVKTPALSTDTVLPRTIGPPTSAELDLLSTNNNPVVSIKQPAIEPVKAQSGLKLAPAAATHTISTNPCPTSCNGKRTQLDTGDSHPRTPWNKLNNNPKHGANKVAKTQLANAKKYYTVLHG